MDRITSEEKEKRALKMLAQINKRLKRMESHRLSTWATITALTIINLAVAVISCVTVIIK